MRPLPQTAYSGPRNARKEGERGAALLLTFLVLIVILMIVYQVTRLASSERNEADRALTETQMVFAIGAALLENRNILKEDSAAPAAGGEDPGMDPSAGADGSGDDGEPAAEEGPSDSLMDSWATVQQTTIGEVDIVTFIVDEDRKFNILAMLDEDQEIASEAEAIVVRILDACREGTTHDIDGGTATEMAQVMRRFFTDRISGTYPTPTLVGAEQNGPIMLLSMREFMTFPPFEEYHFRDFFDEQKNRVHAIDSFLTAYSSPVIGPNPSSDLGYAVNVNTAPLPVLAALFDPREIDPRVWLEIIEFRNEEEEPDPDADPEEAQFRQDRFSEELPMLQTFTSLDEVEELPTLNSMDPEVRNEVLARLKIESAVFSVTVLAKRSTMTESNSDSLGMPREELEFQEQDGTDLTRVVRHIVWRQSGDEGATMHTLIPWEVLDYTPLEQLEPED